MYTDEMVSGAGLETLKHYRRLRRGKSIGFNLLNLGGRVDYLGVLTADMRTTLTRPEKKAIPERRQTS